MFKIFEELNKFNNIVYHDEPHEYYINGKKAVSVTKLLHKLEKPFDSKYWSTRKAEERGCSPEEILAEWKLKADIACEKGHSIHAYIENRLANKVFPYPEKKIKAMFEGQDPVKPRYDKIVKLIEKFNSDISNRLISVKSELVVGDEDYLICGMIDQLFYNKKSGMLEIWDWKSNTELTTESNYNFQYPLNHLSNSKLDTYSLQLNTYKHIIEKNTNLKLGNCYLVWFNEENEDYKVIPCKDYMPEVDTMIQYYLKGKKGA
jgi:ATP-dependent exoDNAse (exonuclease V) beta subunit